MNALSPMCRMLLVLVIVFVQFLSYASDFDVPSFYRGRYWSVGEISSVNAVQAITQTIDGFLWIGTQQGLFRFDGERFELVSISSATPAAVEQISALCADPDGSLWVGTRRGLFHGRTGEPWMPVQLPKTLNQNILCLRQMDDSLWIGSQVGLFRHRQVMTNSTSVASLETSLIAGSAAGINEYLAGSFAGMSIRWIEADHKNHMWLSIGDNLMRLTMSDFASSVSYNYHAFNPYFIRAVCCREDGSVWISCNSGTIRFTGGEYTQFTKAEGLPDNTATAIHEDRRGNLWLGTYGGLCRFVNDRFVVETTAEGESYGQVNCFFEDREDNLWVGTKDGLYRLNPQQFSSLTIRHGLAHNNVISVFEDAKTNLWIGTWGGGLHRIDAGRMTLYSTANTKLLRNDLVLALCDSRQGGLWFSQDYDGGLYRWKDGEFQRYDMGRNATRALLEDREGRLWIGRASGNLSLLENGRFTLYYRDSGLPTNAIRCLLQTENGNIWVGTEAGLCRWTNGGFATFTVAQGLCDNMIFALIDGKKQDLWIGTGKGLCRMEGVTRSGQMSPQFKTYPERSGLPQEPILEVVEDDYENLWLATRHGVFRASKKELSAFDVDPKSRVAVTQFGKADGMASPVCVGVAKPSAIKSHDGRLWFATTKGLAVTDPKLQIVKNEKPPFVVIREMVIDKKALSANERTNKNPRSPALWPAHLFLPPGHGELEFHYTALSYTAPEKNRFKYKLEGLDREWVDAGERHTAFYNNVPPGDYTFRVTACNNDGVWNLTGTNMEFALQPHYWQTWWAKSFVLFAGIISVATGARLITKKRMQFKLERLEQQHAIEKERTRIAQDMHDDLGANLTEILLLSNLTKKSRDFMEVETYSGKITHVAQGVIDNLHAIVWAVNPKNDSLDKLIGYICDHAQSFLKLSGVRCRFDSPVEQPVQPLSSEMRHNIFLVVKEALNNVAKHAQASEAWIRFKVEPAKFSICIEDNGKGFSTVEFSSLGNGLQNMEKRIKNLGGCCSISSEPTKGTRVRIEIPLHR